MELNISHLTLFGINDLELRLLKQDKVLQQAKVNKEITLSHPKQEQLVHWILHYVILHVTTVCVSTTSFIHFTCARNVLRTSFVSSFTPVDWCIHLPYHMFSRKFCENIDFVNLVSVQFIGSYYCVVSSFQFQEHNSLIKEKTATS